MKRRYSVLLFAILIPACTAFAEQITITLSFNGSALAANDYIWFSSVFNTGWNSNPTYPVILDVANSVITVTNGAIPVAALLAPDALITLAPNSAEVAAYSANEWQITAWAGATDPPNFFLDGYAWQVPAGGLPGGLAITWTMSVSSNVPGLMYQYQGAAAVYRSSTNFDMGAAGVTATTANALSAAGVPSTYAAGANLLAGGAYSSPGAVMINDPLPLPETPEPATMALVALGAALIGLVGPRCARSRHAPTCRCRPK